MSSDLRTLPRTAEPIGEEFFGVVWADGHESVYPAQHLRDRCPCASCNERRRSGPAAAPGAAGGLSLPVVGTPGSGAPLALERWEPVGRYAIRFFWSDRHDTGIFTYELLRDLCPCEACETERKAGRR